MGKWSGILGDLGAAVSDPKIVENAMRAFCSYKKADDKNNPNKSVKPTALERLQQLVCNRQKESNEK